MTKLPNCKDLCRQVSSLRWRDPEFEYPVITVSFNEEEAVVDAYSDTLNIAFRKISLTTSARTFLLSPHLGSPGSGPNIAA